MKQQRDSKKVLTALGGGEPGQRESQTRLPGLDESSNASEMLVVVPPEIMRTSSGVNQSNNFFNARIPSAALPNFIKTNLLAKKGSHDRGALRSSSNQRSISNPRLGAGLSSSRGFGHKNQETSHPRSLNVIVNNLLDFKIEGVKPKYLQGLYEAKCKDLLINPSKD